MPLLLMAGLQSANRGSEMAKASSREKRFILNLAECSGQHTGNVLAGHLQMRAKWQIGDKRGNSSQRIEASGRAVRGRLFAPARRAFSVIRNLHLTATHEHVSRTD